MSHFEKLEIFSRKSVREGEIILIAKSQGVECGHIKYRERSWDSKLLDVNVGSIDHLSATDKLYNNAIVIKRRLIYRLIEYLKNKTNQFIFARVHSEDLSSIHSLQSAGFEYIENLVTFSYDIGKTGIPASDLSVSPFRSSERDKLASIAEVDFIYDKYHTDPKISDMKANCIKRTWLINALNGYAGSVLVGRQGDEPVGFVICKYIEKEEKIGVIDLIVIARNQRNKGLGAHLLNGAIKWFADEVNIVIAGTQSKNVSSINMYIKCGFKLLNSQVTLRKIL